MQTKNYTYATLNNHDKKIRKAIEFYLNGICVNTYSDTIDFMNFIDYYNQEKYTEMINTYIAGLRKQASWHKFTKTDIDNLKNKLLKILIK